MLLSQMLEDSYQRYLTELEVSRGQKVEGRRLLSDGKVEVLRRCSHLHLRLPSFPSPSIPLFLHPAVPFFSHPSSLPPLSQFHF